MVTSDTVQELKGIADELAALNAQVTEVKRRKNELEAKIIEEMSEVGTTLMRTDFGTLSVNKNEVPSVQDWAAFEEYIYEHKALYLLQRRPSATSYREEVKTQGDLPGVETYTKVTVSLSNAN